LADNHAPDPAGPDDRYPGTPGWVKVLGVVAVVVVLFVVFALVTGFGGPHGPQRHGASAMVAALPLVLA
jgi:hypothetical protein